MSSVRSRAAMSTTFILSVGITDFLYGVYFSDTCNSFRCRSLDYSASRGRGMELLREVEEVEKPV